MWFLMMVTMLVPQNDNHVRMRVVMSIELERSEYRNLGQSNRVVRKAIKRLVPVLANTGRLEVEVKPVSAMAGLKESCEEFLDGTPVRAVRGKVPIGQLVFWPGNPRLFNICGAPPDSQEEVAKLLMQDEHDIADLCVKLARNGGLPEAVLVTPTKSDDKNHKVMYKVMEGNRRTQAIRILTSLEPIPKSWSKAVRQEIAKELEKKPFPKDVPVVMYENMTERQLEVRLAIDHVSGKKQWSPLQKASYAYGLLAKYSKMNLQVDSIGDLRRLWQQLSNIDQECLRTVAQTCGYESDKMCEIRYRVMAFCANCLYQRLYEAEGQGNKFDFFRRFYSKEYWRKMANGQQPSIKEGKPAKQRDILWPDSKIEEKFMDWLADGKIGETLHVDSLHKVLGHEPSRLIFEAEGFEPAFDLWRKDHKPKPKPNVEAEVEAEVEDAVEEYTPDMIFSAANAQLVALEPLSLKAEASQKLRLSLHELKATIAKLEEELGEAL